MGGAGRRLLRWCAMLATLAVHDVVGPRPPPLLDLFTAPSPDPPPGGGNISCWRLGSAALAGRTLLVWANAHLQTPGQPPCADASLNLLAQRRSTDGGRSWAAIEWMAPHWAAAQMAGGGTPLWDAASSKLALHYQLSPRPPATRPGNRTRASVWQVTSTSEGRSWSAPARVDGGFGEHAGLSPGPGAGIVLQRPPHNGRWLLGGWHMHGRGVTTLAYGSDSRGARWNASRPAVLAGPFGEPAIVELSNGTIMLNMRLDSWQFPSLLPSLHSKCPGYMCRGVAISTSGGATWTDPWLVSQLISPDDVASVVRGVPGAGMRWPIFYSSPLAQGKPRDDLSLLVTDSDGRSWRKVARVWQGDSKYSALAPLNASHVAVAFERGSHSPHTPAGSASMYSLLSLGVVELGSSQ